MDIGLRFEDRLDGEVNFSPWKERIVYAIKDHVIPHVARK
jgi:hypothetical protein